MLSQKKYNFSSCIYMLIGTLICCFSYSCKEKIDWNQIREIRFYSRSDLSISDFESASEKSLDHSNYKVCNVNEGILRLSKAKPLKQKGFMRKGSSQLLLVILKDSNRIRLEVLASGEIIRIIGKNKLYGFEDSGDDGILFNKWLRKCADIKFAPKLKNDIGG